jgi:hypothetical protein
MLGSPVRSRRRRQTVHLPLEPESAVPARPPGAGVPSPRLRIVVAEDNADPAATLRLLLELSGHEVHVAHAGLSKSTADVPASGVRRS